MKRRQTNCGSGEPLRRVETSGREAAASTTWLVSGIVLGALVASLSSCSDKDTATVVVTYRLETPDGSRQLTCSEADVSRIQVSVFRDPTAPVAVREAPCRDPESGYQEEALRFPAGNYLAVRVRMLRPTGAVACMVGSAKAVWDFMEEGAARLPKGGRVILSPIAARFDIDHLPHCGNGILEGCEECDDGNREDGDGCSAVCTIETTECGNGIQEAGEECDDGNREDGDGCSATCRLESQGGDLEPDAGLPDAGSGPDAGALDASTGRDGEAPDAG